MNCIGFSWHRFKDPQWQRVCILYVCVCTLNASRTQEDRTCRSDNQSPSHRTPRCRRAGSRLRSRPTYSLKWRKGGKENKTQWWQSGGSEGGRERREETLLIALALPCVSVMPRQRSAANLIEPRKWEDGRRKSGRDWWKTKERFHSASCFHPPPCGFSPCGARRLCGASHKQLAWWQRGGVCAARITTVAYLRNVFFFLGLTLSSLLLCITLAYTYRGIRTTCSLPLHSVCTCNSPRQASVTPWFPSSHSSACWACTFPSPHTPTLSGTFSVDWNVCKGWTSSGEMVALVSRRWGFMRWERESFL